MKEHMTQQVKSISVYENDLTCTSQLHIHVAFLTSIVDRPVTHSLSGKQRIF